MKQKFVVAIENVLEGTIYTNSLAQSSHYIV